MYALATRITFICPMKFNAFPMDIQICLFQVRLIFRSVVINALNLFRRRPSFFTGGRRSVQRRLRAALCFAGFWFRFRLLLRLLNMACPFISESCSLCNEPMEKVPPAKTVRKYWPFMQPDSQSVSPNSFSASSCPTIWYILYVVSESRKTHKSYCCCISKPLSQWRKYGAEEHWYVVFRLYILEYQGRRELCVASCNSSVLPD